MVMGLAKKILVTLVLLVMVAPLMAAQKGLLYEVSRPGEAQWRQLKPPYPLTG